MSSHQSGSSKTAHAGGRSLSVAAGKGYREISVVSKSMADAAKMDPSSVCDLIAKAVSPLVNRLPRVQSACDLGNDLLEPVRAKAREARGKYV